MQVKTAETMISIRSQVENRWLKSILLLQVEVGSSRKLLARARAAPAPATVPPAPLSVENARLNPQALNVVFLVSSNYRITTLLRLIKGIQLKHFNEVNCRNWTENSSFSNQSMITVITNSRLQWAHHGEIHGPKWQVAH